MNFDAKLQRLAELTEAINATKPLKEELDGLKFEIMEEMITRKSKRTEVIDGFSYYVVRAERKSVSIASPRKIVNWIKKQDNLKLEEFLKLDTDKVKLLADKVLKEDGEFLPGVESTNTEYISVRKEKEE